MTSTSRVLLRTCVLVLLLALAGCLEGFETLITRVRYDPYAQTFEVERVLVGIAPSFLGCDTPEPCAEVLARLVRLAPVPDATVADRLLQRLLSSGATNVSVETRRTGDRLDLAVRYTAAIGTPAADDTFVHVEWEGRDSPGRYRLAIDAQESMEPPDRYRSRKVAHAGEEGTDWLETWVLPRRQRSVDTTMTIGSPTALFAAVPGLDAALAARGLLRGGEPRLTVAPPSAPPPGAGAGAVTAVTPAATAGVPGDPASPARVWFYEAQVTGALPAAVAATARADLEPAVVRCYEETVRDRPDVAGNAFVSATVRGDGTIVRTSVYGDVGDPPLAACLERAASAWRFPGWGSAADSSEVTVPMVLRVD